MAKKPEQDPQSLESPIKAQKTEDEIAIEAAEFAEARDSRCIFDVPADWERYDFSADYGRKEGKAAHHGNLFALVVTEKGEDALRVREDDDGKIRIALADGMTCSYLGRDTALAVSKAGLNVLATEQVSPRSFGCVAKELDTHRKDGRTFLEYANEMPPLEKPWGFRNMSVADYIETDTLGASTLCLGTFHKVTNVLNAGFTGDSPLYIYREEMGALEKYTAGNQLYYKAKGSEAGRPGFREFTLQDGEIFFFASDGLGRDGLEKALQGKRSGKEVLEALQKHIEENRRGVEDDISVVGAVVSKK